MSAKPERQPVGMTDTQREQLELIRQKRDGIERKQMIKALAEECRVDVQSVEAELNPNGSHPDDSKQGTAVAFKDPESWPERVDGAVLLDEIATWLSSFVDMPKAAADACALWAADTWCVGIAYCAPLLIITAPTMQSGKTRLLGLVGSLVRRPHLTSGTGVSAAVIFRLNEKHIPTFLIDEAERLRGDGDSRDIISLLNNGYERGGKVSRCSGDDQEVRMFDAFGFRALVAIRDLAGTLMDRAIVVRLMRAPKNAQIRRARGRAWRAEGAVFARKLARWTADHMAEIEAAEESVPRPDELDDRACDKWVGLFAIATVAGGDWPERAQAAALALSSGEAVEDQTTGVALLRCVRRYMGDCDRIETAEIVRLAALDDEAPAGPGGRDLIAKDVARLLKPFGVRPRGIRLPGGRTPNGYLLEDLQPVFDRYLNGAATTAADQPPPQVGSSETPQGPQWLNHAENGQAEKVHTVPSVGIVNRPGTRMAEPMWRMWRMGRGVWHRKSCSEPRTTPCPRILSPTWRRWWRRSPGAPESRSA
jgi:hypothetical protein